MTQPRYPDKHTVDCRMPGLRTTGLPNDDGRTLYVCKDDDCTAVFWLSESDLLPAEWKDQWGQPITSAWERRSVLGATFLRVTFPKSDPGWWHRESVRKGWTMCGQDFAAFGNERGRPDAPQDDLMCSRCWSSG